MKQFQHLILSLASLVSSASIPHADQRQFQAETGPACDFRVGDPVNTTSGLVQGHRSINSSTVSEYLGIPYALPPTGILRFAPPVRYYGSTNISGATYGSICPQTIVTIPTGVLDPNAFNLLSALSYETAITSEDCLTINVWSKPQSGSAKKPVMLWVYGGGFTTGGTNTTVYAGQFWAETEDVVFVNFNYRIGVFGFPGAPGITQNVGLLDQRMAVEWVRDNIAGFGGDPDRIILFGESAGGASVDFYTYAWTADPIIAGTISESGQANGFGNKDAASQAGLWYKAAQTLGCGTDATTSAADVLSCMRSSKVTPEGLLNATAASGPLAGLTGNFQPTIDNKTVFSNYTDLGLKGAFMKLPYLLGNNDYEAGLFILIEAAANVTNTQSFWDQFTELIFTCPSNTAAYVRSLAGVPVWRYRYFGMFPNLELPTSVGRAYHTSEIPPMFGTSEASSKQDSTWQERALGTTLRSAWAAFAHCPESGLSSVFGWPQYSAQENETGLIMLGDRGNGTGAQFVNRGLYDGTCPLVYIGN